MGPTTVATTLGKLQSRRLIACVSREDVSHERAARDKLTIVLHASKCASALKLGLRECQAQGGNHEVRQTKVDRPDVYVASSHSRRAGSAHPSTTGRIVIRHQAEAT